MNSFLKKVAIVTGSTSGIGQQTALLIARNGGSVVIHGQNEGRMKKTLELFAKEKIPEDRILSILGPVQKSELRKKLIDETVKKFGRLDILVNNAGVSSNKPLCLEECDRVFDINAKSVFALSQLAIPHLSQSKGNIVNVSSDATILGAPMLLNYSMSKAALEQQVKNLAIMFASDGIRVNGVCVGLTTTNIGEGFGVPEAMFEEVFDKYVKLNVPQRRFAQPVEVAKVIEFLASDRASYVTGSMYIVDGGQACGAAYDQPKPKEKKQKKQK
ncbi:hypothetical protein M3Y97_00690400 [Aphelenchoides bicaudatus]|nr:hypothetical protein M3Y97_00690400 [Aphelenchoides bicaudatus]